MRIATQTIYDINVQSLQQGNGQLGKVLSQMSTQKRILTPSDDPIGAVQVLSVRKDLASSEQHLKNIDELSVKLSRSESNLTSMVNLQKRMREIVTLAGNGALTTNDRTAYANELDSLKSAMVDFANAKDEKGSYLFAGNMNSTKPIELDASGKYVYKGDGKTREVPVEDNTWLSANEPGDQLFFGGAGKDIFNGLADYIEVLKDPTQEPGKSAFTASEAGVKGALDTSLKRISGAITSIGGRQNSLSLLKSAHEEMQLFNKKLIGDVEGLDYAEANRNFELNLAALKVTQKSFARISQLSLFNEL